MADRARWQTSQGLCDSYASNKLVAQVENLFVGNWVILDGVDLYTSTTMAHVDPSGIFGDCMVDNNGD